MALSTAAGVIYYMIKRVFDMAFALTGLIIAAPIILIAAIAVKLDSPGPAFFRQIRVGRNETSFVCIKLRTMRADTGDRPTHEALQSSVTEIGRFLRHTKIDELPQLWNVLKGEMSLVGPRPCLPSQHQLISERHQRGVYDLSPGITGVAQIAGVDMSEPKKLAVLDASYKPSIKNDFAILLATVSGAGQGDNVAS